MIARVAYALLFAVALPVLLTLWGMRLETLLALPGHGSRGMGVAVAIGGATLLTTGIVNLWVYGRGFPASPFPPKRLVTGGVYRIMPDPIYSGAIMISVGVSLATRSGAGLWIVSSTLVMASAAFVIGFEREATRNRYGACAASLLRLPPATDSRPTAWDRIAVYLLLFVQWFVFCGASEYLLRIPWSEATYAEAYPLILMAPLVAVRRRDLRRFAVGGMWATALIIPALLLVPLSARPAIVFPALGFAWVCLAARLCAVTWPRSWWVWWVLVALIAVNRVATGVHALINVAGGFAIYALVETRQRLWRRACDFAEAVANSWKEHTVGEVRLINHGLYAGVGVATGLGVAVTLAGSDYLWWLLALTLASVLGAGLWAQAVEGSQELLRPYGYFGAVFGAIAVGLVAGMMQADVWPAVSAFAIGAAFAQSIGRMRCLVQGCCHGREAPPSLGIRYTHPQSRVVRLSALEGIPLHPTPLYSTVWTLFVGLFLVRLWAIGFPLQFILGSYFILIGVGRFAEEHFRGEPQTAVIAGLRIYQWLAIAFVIGGAAVTTLGNDTAPVVGPPDPRVLPVLLATGVACYAAFGIDFPGSKRRFSRLGPATGAK